MSRQDHPHSRRRYAAMAVSCLLLGACLPQAPRQFDSQSPPPSPSPQRSEPQPPPEDCKLTVDGAANAELSGCTAGDIIALAELRFAIASHALSEDAQRTLGAAADALMKRQDVEIEVQGHADQTGPAEGNKRLSERRAKAVYEHLVQSGVAEERLAWRGFGDSQPLDTSGTQDGHARNRRVALAVVAADTPEADQRDLSKVPDALGRDITIDGMAFEPAAITVSPGTTVIWHNESGSDHTVRFPDRESFRIPHGETYRRRFDRSGSFSYDCGIHPSMRGEITVQAP